MTRGCPCGGSQKAKHSNELNGQTVKTRAWQREVLSGAVNPRVDKAA